MSWVSNLPAIGGLCLCLFLLTPPDVGIAQMKMKAKGIDLCILCHPDLKNRFDKPFKHTPVRKGECIGCHNPHASKEKHLLARSGSEACYGCHEKEKKQFAKDYIHTPVRKGDCIGCHDPHGSENRFSLVKRGSALCFSCHPQTQAIQKAKVVHSPFREGKCHECHDPHVSKHQYQLMESPDKICLKCHETRNPKIQKAHYQFPIGKAECTSCHNPHGSEQAGLIRAKAHMVFRECSSCHTMTGPNPQELRIKGRDLCFKCHPKKKEDLQKRVVHKAMEDDCTICHTPHAADDKGLLKGKERSLCFTCHGEIKEHLSKSISMHPTKVEGGRCTICHEPHASQQIRLLSANTLDLCKKCHGKHGQFSHPYGPGVIDPRNRQIITCLSCHDAHGTQLPFILLQSPQRALCIQCHVPEEGGIRHIKQKRPTTSPSGSENPKP